MGSAAKRQKLESINIACDTEKLNINKILVDDCLIKVFEFLPVADKLMTELVCLRWRSLKNFLYNKVNCFVIDEKINQDKRYFDKINYIKNVLIRCGPHLNNLTMHKSLQIDYSVICQEISNKCKNIIELELKDFDYKEEKYFECIFKSNQKISTVKLKNVFFFGNSLLHLCTDSITEFHLLHCVFLFTGQYLLDFFSALKNIQIIKIHTGVLVKTMLDGLNTSNCENIEELSVVYAFENCASELSQLLSRQKKLSKLYLELQSVDKKFYDCLQGCPLNELSIEVNEEIFYNFSYFEQLTVLQCYILNLKDEIFIKNFNNCTNLKKLTLSVKDLSLTVASENIFAGFINLESFTINCLKTNVDWILELLSKFKKNIKELNTIDCEISETGLKNISLLKNLKILKLSVFRENISHLVDTIYELSNLEELTIRSDAATYSFFQKINDAKISRGDKKVLKIYVKDSELKKINDKFSLVSVFSYDRKDLMRFCFWK